MDKLLKKIEGAIFESLESKIRTLKGIQDGTLFGIPGYQKWMQARGITENDLYQDYFGSVNMYRNYINGHLDENFMANQLKHDYRQTLTANILSREEQHFKDSWLRNLGLGILTADFFMALSAYQDKIIEPNEAMGLAIGALAGLALVIRYSIERSHDRQHDNKSNDLINADNELWSKALINIKPQIKQLINAA